MTVVAGLDVGATWIKGALLDAGGRRMTEIRYPTRREDGRDAVLRRVCQLAAWLADTAGDEPQVVAFGVAVCGTVDRAGLVTSVNLGWNRDDLGAAIRRHTGIPAVVLNDAHAGAIGETPGRGDYLYVSLGTGIGAAIVSDGQLRDGAHNHAGELGHIVIDPSGPPCACGGRGCLETFMSAAALEARWRERSGTELTASELIDLVLVDDPAASELWLEAIDALASGLLTAVSLLDPSAIIVGGGLAHAGQHLVGPLGRSIRARSRGFQSVGDLRLATHGDWSNCAGAALRARDQLSASA